LISVDRALEIVLASAPVLPAEPVELAAALGRVLAEDVAADTDLPPFDRAAMDGYAVRAGEAATPFANLTVVDEVRAGQYPDRDLEAGEAIRIMTGAPVPRGADAVQPVEKTRILDSGRRVELLSAVAPGQHIARRGSETKQGERVLERGATLDAAAIAVLATVGKGRVLVGRRPEVALLVTGDELVDVWTLPVRGRIRNSNGPALAALVRAAGGVPVDLGVAPDERDALVKALRAGFQHDVLLVSGGVSAGAYDLVEEALSQYDVKAAFDKVAIKPGAPFVFGRRGDKLVFGLPGNPVSTQVTFDVFVRAALLRLQGARVCARPTVTAELVEPLRNRSGRRAYLPVVLRFEDGGFRAQPLPTMGSADVVTHARANGLAIVESDQLEVASGARVPVLLVASFLDRDFSPA
jgi:molybdenum cofactor synthesis domain-containing protein